jgi:intergrase/recombinase
MDKDMSKSFSFFVKKLQYDNDIKLKYLRKTFITSLERFAIQHPVIKFHSNYETTARHYINQKEIAAELTKQNIQVFPDLK